jgi:hypothetical protein
MGKKSKNRSTARGKSSSGGTVALKNSGRSAAAVQQQDVAAPSAQHGDTADDFADLEDCESALKRLLQLDSTSYLAEEETRECVAELCQTLERYSLSAALAAAACAGHTSQDP